MKTALTIIILALVAWVIYAFVIRNKTTMTDTTGTATDSTPPVSNDVSVTPTGTTTSATTTATTTTPALKEFVVKGQNFSFSPSTLTVNKGDRVRIVFQNTGGTHDWVIDEFKARTNRIGSGQSQTIEFVADKTGSFEYYCSVGTHRQMGMRGTLVVK